MIGFSFRDEYENDSCGAMDYVEYLEGRLHSELSQKKEIMVSGESLYQMLDIQLNRESEKFHLTAATMLRMWLDAMNDWSKKTRQARFVKKEDYI